MSDIEAHGIQVNPVYQDEPSYDLIDALRLVLLFHGGGPWDETRIAEWNRITGTKEATTKVMCDHVRSAIAVYDGHQP